MNRDKQFNLRLTTQELQQLRDKAKELGQSVGMYIREQCIYKDELNVYTQPETKFPAAEPSQQVPKIETTRVEQKVPKTSQKQASFGYSKGQSAR